MRDTDPQAERPRCPECAAAVPCGARLSEAHCWCMAYPSVAPDPALPEGACLCEPCLLRRLAELERVEW